MVWYILLVAVLNLTVGFAVALYAGKRYRDLCILAVESTQLPDVSPAPDGQLQMPMPPREDDEDELPDSEEPSAKSGEGADDEVATASTPGGRETGEPTPQNDVEARGPQGSETDEIAPPEASSSDTESTGAEPPEKKAPGGPTPNQELSPSERSLAQFEHEVEQYHQELARLDSAFRACREDPDARKVESFVQSLQAANAGHVASRNEVHQAFQELHADEETLQGVNTDLRAVVGQQDAQIEATNGVIDGLDYDEDLDEGCRKIVQETTKLLHANHALRDKLGEASAPVAQNAGGLESIDPARRNDPLTELSSRAGLEACLAEWWAKDPHRAKRLNAAMIDVDHFGRLNECYGHETCDRILRAIARLLTTETRNHLLIARFSGQRFVLLFPDVDLRFSISMVERLRQTIEMVRLEYRNEEIRITVSCAVTEVTKEDTAETLYARAETTLQEAKRYGRNRSFVHEGRFPTPVVPPNFTLEEKHVTI